MRQSPAHLNPYRVRQNAGQWHGKYGQTLAKNGFLRTDLAPVPAVPSAVQKVRILWHPNSDTRNIRPANQMCNSHPPANEPAIVRAWVQKNSVMPVNKHLHYVSSPRKRVVTILCAAVRIAPAYNGTKNEIACHCHP